MIFDVVRDTGLPNSLGARIPVPTTLNVPEWERLLGHDNQYDELLDFISYGFPLAYMGPVTLYQSVTT